eukprot:UN01047
MASFIFLVFVGLLLRNNAQNGFGTWQWNTGLPSDTTNGQFYGTAPSCDGACESPNTFLWFNALTDGDGNPCDTGKKVYCNTFGSYFSSWEFKGSAPFCSSDCSDCGSETCIAWDGCGTGACCSFGQKTLCGTRNSDNYLVYSPEI